MCSYVLRQRCGNILESFLEYVAATKCANVFTTALRWYCVTGAILCKRYSVSSVEITSTQICVKPSTSHVATKNMEHLFLYK